MWTATLEEDPRGTRRRAASRDALKSSMPTPLRRGESSPNLLQYQHHHAQLPSQSQSPSPSPGHHHQFEGMLEPAVEGPPSPERLRQLSKQMKRASYLNRPLPPHRSATPSTTASPLRSPNKDILPWEAYENAAPLSRRPSSRSNDGSLPTSRERPERESILGRNLFQRSKITKRASSTYSSSNSSMYSAEGVIAGEGGLKDVLVPTLFARRKPSRDETAQKKLQISGPFNFQHVKHTDRETASTLQHANRVALTSEFSRIGSPGPATAPSALMGIEAHDLHADEFRVEGLGASPDLRQLSLEERSLAPPPQSRPALLPRHTAPALGPRTLKHAKSQEMLRSSPPRAALRSQSPTESGNFGQAPSSPPVPPRNSSRQSLLPMGFSAYAAGASIDRPRTSGGFRPTRQQHASIDESLDQSPSPPATSYGLVPAADFAAFGIDETGATGPGPVVGGSHAVTTPDDAAWPLTGPIVASYEKALPDVPEEDEHFGASGRSRVSLASNNSLRGSQSVPALRSFGQAQRPTSGHSDTLGSFDLVAAQRALRASQQDPSHDPFSVGDAAPIDDSWEDVIDYCYEHEAEANFDYQWERPSLDVGGDASLAAIQEAMDDEGLAEAHARLPGIAEISTDGAISPTMSPSSHPSSTSLNVMSNFSLPRGEKSSRISHLKSLRPTSTASSFKECHGFNLSPSLLIPGDYHQQMLLVEAERQDYHADDEVFRQAYQGPFYDEMDHSNHDKSPLSYEQRSSTSTTATNSSSHFDMAGERHASANSTFTNLTRLTVSSSNTSLNKAAGIVTESSEPMPATQTIDAPEEFDEDQENNATPPANKDTVPELVPFPVMNFAKKPYHKSHASESVVREEVAPLKSPQDALKMQRRPRARTTSMSTQAPPVGQYALFPRNYLKSTGGQI